MARFIPNYKYYADKNYQMTGCIDLSRITNLHVSMARKNEFEVRAFLEGSTDGKVIFFGEKEKCNSFLKEFISTDGAYAYERALTEFHKDQPKEEEAQV